MKGLQQIMKQANQMQNRIKKMQEDFAQKKYQGTAGGGVVNVETLGDSQVSMIKISPDIFKSADAEMVEDLIVTAVNEALKKAKDEYATEMGKLTGGLNIG